MNHVRYLGIMVSLLMHFLEITGVCSVLMSHISGDEVEVILDIKYDAADRCHLNVGREPMS